MIPTLESLKCWNRDPFGSYWIDLEDGQQIWFERLVTPGQFYLAVYKDLELVVPKVVIKIGKE